MQRGRGHEPLCCQACASPHRVLPIHCTSVPATVSHTRNSDDTHSRAILHKLSASSPLVRLVQRSEEPPNMPLALEHPEPIDKYLAREIAGGRVLDPFPRGSIPGLQINCLGVVLKNHTPGRWRLITDLSFPEGCSVNDGIDPILCSLHYTSVDQVAQVGWLYFLLLPRQALPLAYPPLQTFFPLSIFCLQESLGKAGNFPKNCANS